MKNIVLIGFMGSGKSSIANFIAKKLKFQCIETDDLILERSGRKSIREIFERDGEIRFREMELEIAKKLHNKTGVVISTGGGMIINKLCIDYLKEYGVVVHLSTSMKEIERRLKGDNTRPLFTDIKKAKKLFKFRKSLYAEYADIGVSTDGMSIDEITNNILEKL